MTAERWLLVALLSGGAWLRIHGVAAHGLWIDEYGTGWTIAGGSAAETVRRSLAIHGQSPLYYLLVQASAALLGDGPAGLRLPSLVSGLGLLALAFPLGLRVFRDRHAALLAVAAFAVNDRLIYASQEARPYALALLGAAASFCCYADLLARGGRRAWLGWVAATVLTVYAHYLFGIVIAVQALHLALRRPWRERWPWRDPGGRRWLQGFVAIGVLLLPGLAQLVPLFARRESIDWIETPAGALASAGLAAELLDPVAFATIGGLALLAWLRRRGEVRFASGATPGLPLLWFALPLLAYAVAAPLAGISLVTARYVAVVVPAAALIHALLLAVPRASPVLRWLSPAAFLAVVLVLRVGPLVRRDGGPFWWFFQHGWQPAMATLVAEHRPGDLILYRTGFVELDQLVRGRADAWTTGFVEWPVAAHLPPDRRFERHALPYRDTPETRSTLRATLRDAPPQGRVWVVGLDPEDSTGLHFGGLSTLAEQALPLRGLRHRHYGVVHLLLMEPVASAQAPAAGGSRSPSGRP